MMTKNRAPAHVRHLGAPKTAKTLGGVQITRQDSLLVPEWSAFVPCAPYDDHFLYANPHGEPGTSSYMCTCGAAAVVINHEKPGTRMFVCQMHATTGAHATSFVNLDSFEKVAGETITL